MSEVLHTGEAVASEMTTRRDARPWLLAISVLVILLDRASKNYVAAHVLLGARVPVVPRVFWISHVLNPGAAFSLFADSNSPGLVWVGLVSFSLIAAMAVLGMLWRYGKVWSLSAVGFALVLGGAVGNLYDRAVYRYVVDFLQVHIFSYEFPDFNVADSCITVGAVLLISSMIFGSESSQRVSGSAGSGDVAAGDLRG